MRYQAVHRLRGEYPVRRLCRTIGAPESGYYRWRTRETTARVREDRRLKQKILSIHAQANECYGTWRVERVLRRQGVSTSRRRVGRLRRELGLKALGRRYHLPLDSGGLALPGHRPRHVLAPDRWLVGQ
jgi:putative transposase